MRIGFWYEYGRINEMGTDHKFRSQSIGKALSKLGHKVYFIEDDVITNDLDILIIDHMFPPKSVVARAKSAGIKTIIIDGKDQDADIAISAFLNENANYKGSQFTMFPVFPHTTKYNVEKYSSSVFVGMGGFDKNNYTNMILEVLNKMNINAIVAKSINHPDFRRTFPNMEFFEEENYYDAMHECALAITNGGLTFFQALHYGIPTIAIPQYEHQKTNILSLEHCCIYCEPNRDEIKSNIKKILSSSYYRNILSAFSKYYVDGKGVERICDIIEGKEPCKQEKLKL